MTTTPELVIIIVIAVAAGLIYFLLRSPGPQTPPRDLGESEWQYGDVWKQDISERQDEREPESYVEILRTDTGAGHDDSSMIDLVSYLGSRGIRATFDSFSLGLELAAIKTYVLKVEAGKEEEALRYLKEKAATETNGKS